MNPTREFNALAYQFTVSGSATIYAGQDIYLHTDGTVRPVSTAGQLPIGFAIEDVAVGETGNFQTYFSAVRTGYVAGSTATGAWVKQNSTTNGSNPVLSVYAAAATGYNNTIVLKGRGNAGEITVGIFRTPLNIT